MRILKKKYMWLENYHYDTVRYVFKYQADAWKSYYEGRAKRPRFHNRDKTKSSFTLPDRKAFTLRGKKLTIKGKWMCTVTLRRKGGNPYPDGIPKQVTVFKKGRKWWASITYAIDEPVVEDTGVVAGIDRNGNGMIAAAYSDESDLEVLDSKADKRIRRKKCRYERKFAEQRARQKAEGRTEMSNRAKETQAKIQKCDRYLANFRQNRNHQNSAKIAKRAPVVVLEKLGISALTKSAKGTKENPGKNVKAKAGLNRVLLEGAPGQLARMFDYKCLSVLYVVVPIRVKTVTNADTGRTGIVLPCANSSICPVGMQITRISMQPQTYWPPGLGLLGVQGVNRWVLR